MTSLDSLVDQWAKLSASISEAEWWCSLSTTVSLSLACSAVKQITKINLREQTQQLISIDEKMYTSLRCKLREFVFKFILLLF